MAKPLASTFLKKTSKKNQNPKSRANSPEGKKLKN